MPVLAHSIVAPKSARPATRAVVFLHGILGSGSNFRSIARAVVDRVDAEPDAWSAVLVDLRMHGASQDFPPPHTLAACADDLHVLAASLALPIGAVVGHSFGGKVALAYAEKMSVDRLVILDSNPGPRLDANGSESTVAIVALLSRLASTTKAFATRDAFVAQIVEAGHPRALGQWLAMNLVRVGDAFENRLDLTAISALLDDYFARDLWSVLEGSGHAQRWRVVLGGTSRVFRASDVERLRAARDQAPLRRAIATVEGAGHWVHVDAPEAVIAAIVSTLTSQQ